MKFATRILTLIATVLLTGCTGDVVVSNKYCNYPARFSYSPISAVSQLYTACNSLGEWSTITAKNSQYIFSNLTGNTPVNVSAVQNYTSYNMGYCSCGYLVGLPSIPEVGTTQSVVTCYDLACSNCFRDRSVSKRLTLQASGKAYCSSCQRTYDLNNIGQVCQGDAGINLFRYRIYYGNNTLSINNR